MSKKSPLASLPVPSTIETQVITITPELALDWLTTRNIHNRKLRERHVRDLALQMKTGTFVFNGDPIRFAANGDLLDGQHRLQACVEAEVPFQALVIYGLENEVQDTMDIGQNRHVGDVLELANIKNSHKIGTLAALAMKYERKELVSKPAPYPANSVKAWVLENNDALQESYSYVMSCSPPHRCGLSPIHLSFLLYEATKVGLGDVAREFVYGYSTRLGITQGSGIHRLVRFVDINNRPNAKPNRLIYMAVLFLCFNQFVEGRKATRSFTPGSIQDKLNREGFPMITTKR